MQPAGLAAFKLRKDHKSGIYSYEREVLNLSPEFVRKFKANKKAWDFFTTQAPSYQKVIIHWIMTAKQDVTRLTRLDKAISASSASKRLS